MRISGYAHLQYYHNLVLKIFQLCNDLNQYTIKIIKVKSHSNNYNNNKVDKMAKNICSLAVKWKKTNHNNWCEEVTPAIVSISFFNELIDKKHSKINYKRWKKRGNIIKQRKIDSNIDKSIIYY